MFIWDLFSLYSFSSTLHCAVFSAIVLSFQITLGSSKFWQAPSRSLLINLSIDIQSFVLFLLSLHLTQPAFFYSCYLASVLLYSCYLISYGKSINLIDWEKKNCLKWMLMTQVCRTLLACLSNHIVVNNFTRKLLFCLSKTLKNIVLKKLNFFDLLSSNMNQWLCGSFRRATPKIKRIFYKDTKEKDQVIFNIFCLLLTSKITITHTHKQKLKEKIVSQTRCLSQYSKTYDITVMDKNNSLWYRSSHSQMFLIMSVLKNFAIII